MKRDRYMLALSLSTVLLLGLTGCGIRNSTQPPAPAEPGVVDTSAPPAAPKSPAPAEPTPARDVPVLIYLLSDEHLVAVRRNATSSATLKESLTALFEGPTPAEAAAGLSSLVPEGATLLGVSLENKVARVDVSGSFESGGGSLSALGRVAQVVFTATQFPTVESVVFSVDGKPVTSITSEGVVVDTPQTRGTFEDLSAVILVESPVRGDTVSLANPLRVKGTANTFEAQFMVTVRGADGSDLVEKSVMATSGTGTRGTFDVSTPLSASAEVGKGAIVVWYHSAKDGAPVIVDTVPVTFER